jgi:hypothetical protein
VTSSSSTRGWTKLIGKDNKRYNAGDPGLGVGGAKYLSGLGVVAVGADTWGVEAVPFEKDTGRVRSPPDPAADQRGLHPREHEHRGDGQGQGVGVAPSRSDPRATTGAVQGIINPIAIK